LAFRGSPSNVKLVFDEATPAAGVSGTLTRPFSSVPTALLALSGVTALLGV
jgi:hypothetical protein